MSAWRSFTTQDGFHLTAYDDLHALSTQYGKPVFASEVGYSSGDFVSLDAYGVFIGQLVR